MSWASGWLLGACVRAFFIVFLSKRGSYKYILYNMVFVIGDFHAKPRVLGQNMAKDTIFGGK